MWRLNYEVVKTSVMAITDGGKILERRLTRFNSGNEKTMEDEDDRNEGE